MPGVWGREPPTACDTKCVSGGPGGEAPGKIVGFEHVYHRNHLARDKILIMRRIDFPRKNALKYRSQNFECLFEVPLAILISESFSFSKQNRIAPRTLIFQIQTKIQLQPKFPCVETP